MGEGEAPPRTGEAPLVRTSIDPRAARKGSAGPIPPAMVLGYVDLAITGTLEYDRYADVYLGPWWDVEHAPEGSSAWKRSVLRRVPSRGAQNWGHLYLIVEAPGPGSVRLVPRDWRGRPVTSDSEAPRVLLRYGSQRAELVVVPTAPERMQEIRGFAEEVAARFQRQLD